MDLRGITTQQLKKELIRREREIAREKRWEKVLSANTNEPLEVLHSTDRTLLSAVVKRREYTFTWYNRGNEVLCKMAGASGEVEAIAKCNKEDKFMFTKGAKLSEVRARAKYAKLVADSIEKRMM